MNVPRLLLAAVLVAGSSLWIDGYQEPDQRPSVEIMWRKLDLSHRVLDALVLDDFEALEAYSSDLASLGQAGEWVLTDLEGYTSRSAGFRRSAAELGRAARARDTEAATLAYVDLTLGCVGCHRSLLPR
jgi:hypothetical protein